MFHIYHLLIRANKLTKVHWYPKWS